MKKNQPWPAVIAFCIFLVLLAGLFGVLLSGEKTYCSHGPHVERCSRRTLILMPIGKAIIPQYHRCRCVGIHD